MHCFFREDWTQSSADLVGVDGVDTEVDWTQSSADLVGVDGVDTPWMEVGWSQSSSLAADGEDGASASGSAATEDKAGWTECSKPPVVADGSGGNWSKSMETEDSVGGDWLEAVLGAVKSINTKTNIITKHLKSYIYLIKLRLFDQLRRLRSNNGISQNTTVRQIVCHIAPSIHAFVCCQSRVVSQHNQ